MATRTRRRDAVASLGGRTIQQCPVARCAPKIVPRVFTVWNVMPARHVGRKIMTRKTQRDTRVDQIRRLALVMLVVAGSTLQLTRFVEHVLGNGPVTGRLAQGLRRLIQPSVQCRQWVVEREANRVVLCQVIAKSCLAHDEFRWWIALRSSKVVDGNRPFVTAKTLERVAVGLANRTGSTVDYFASERGGRHGVAGCRGRGVVPNRGRVGVARVKSWWTVTNVTVVDFTQPRAAGKIMFAPRSTVAAEARRACISPEVRPVARCAIRVGVIQSGHVPSEATQQDRMIDVVAVTNLAIPFYQNLVAARAGVRGMAGETCIQLARRAKRGDGRVGDRRAVFLVVLIWDALRRGRWRQKEGRHDKR